MGSKQASSLDGISDDVIIRVEINELADLLESQKQRKRDLIIQAAEKLSISKYHDDKSIICSKLKAILCKDKIIKDKAGNTTNIIYQLVSAKYVEQILPSEYKRQKSDSVNSTQKSKDTPANLVEEIFFWLEDITKDMAVVATENRKQLQALRTSENPKYNKLYTEIISDIEDIVKHKNLIQTFDYFKKQLEEILQIKDYLTFLKEIKATVQSLKKMTDKRQKFSTALKIHMKIAFLTQSYDHLAKKLFGSKYGKWASTIDKCPDIKALNDLIKCPECGLDAERYIAKAKTNMDMGLDLPDMIGFCSDQYRDTHKKSSLN